MKMNIDTILTISLAQRQAMRALRREYRGLSKNAIDVLLYAIPKPFITANEVATKCLFSNAVQTKATIRQLRERNLMLAISRGTKRRPTLYLMSQKGRMLVVEFLQQVGTCVSDITGKQ